MKRLLCMLAILAVTSTPALFAQEGETPEREAERPERDAERPRGGEGRRPGPQREGERPQRGAANMEGVRELSRLARRFSESPMGRMSKEEFGNDELFDKLDANEDGYVDVREMMADTDAVLKHLQAREHAVFTEEFKILDRDEDGFLTKEELGEKYADLLEEGDKNEDAKLDLKEWITAREAQERARAMPQRGQGGPGGERGGMRGDPGAMFDRLDSEGKGKLAREDFPEMLRGAFDDMDADDDGFVTRDEFVNYMNERRGAQRPGQGRGERGERGRSERGERPQRPERPDRADGEEDF